MPTRTVDLGKVVGPAGPNEVSSSTDTALNGVLFGNGSKVGAKALDTSSLTNDNNHVPTSSVVKSALTSLESDLASIHATGTTNTTGAVIASGTYFYLNGTLVRAKADIAVNATYTSGTNYEMVTAGGLNELMSAFTPKLWYGQDYAANALPDISLPPNWTVLYVCIIVNNPFMSFPFVVEKNEYYDKGSGAVYRAGFYVSSSDWARAHFKIYNSASKLVVTDSQMNSTTNKNGRLVVSYI